MNRDSIYYNQVALLMRLIPLIEYEKDFALKGGTAINLFVQNLPRLSAVSLLEKTMSHWLV